MAILIWARDDFSGETGQKIGLMVGYLVGIQERVLYLPLADLNGKTPAEILASAQARADADTTIAGGIEREDILPNSVREILATSQAELDYLKANIPLIPTLTTVPQLRVAVERLARENQQVIKALVRLARLS